MKLLARLILLITLSTLVFANISFAQESDEPEADDADQTITPPPADEKTTNTTPAATPYVEEKPEDSYKNSVTLQGLNKITTKVSTIDVKKNEIVKFGNLEISLLACWKAPSDEDPENKALLRIWEQVPGEERKEIFHGWMFSSSPSISALEHAVYDVTVIECANKN